MTETVHSDSDVMELPSYARNLLKIEVPIEVRLAQKKQKVEEILHLGPGSIIQFEKSCEDRLHLIVGGQPVAEGDAVKVGDKFGLQISRMTLPAEHFAPIVAKQGLRPEA